MIVEAWMEYGRVVCRDCRCVLERPATLAEVTAAAGHVDYSPCGDLDGSEAWLVLDRLPAGFVRIVDGRVDELPVVDGVASHRYAEDPDLTYTLLACASCAARHPTEEGVERD